MIGWERMTWIHDMSRIVRYALLPAMLGCTVHAELANRCNLTPDMDYIAVELWERVGLESRTYVAGPDYLAESSPLHIDLDRASLKLGMEWWGLPAETPAYCHVTIRREFRPPSVLVPYRIEIYVFGWPKARWPHHRNQGVAGLLDYLEQIHRTSDHAVASISVNVNQAARSWLADYYADIESEMSALDDLLAQSEEDAQVPVPNVAGEDHYLAVATAPPAGVAILPTKVGHYGIGWHTESQYNAGLNAEAVCRGQGGGGACFSDARGKALRGGCVGLGIASWQDRDQRPERAYVVTSSSFRHTIAADLRSRCETAALAGKYEDAVVEHSCEIVDITCAADLAPTTASEP